jgi:hypothetical protein
MKISKNQILILITVLFIVSCRKEKEITVTAHIYGGDAFNPRPLSVFINGEYKGELPDYTQSSLTCGQQGIDTSSLTFLLKSGEHNFVVKNRNGEEVHKSICKLRENGISGSCSQGGQEVTKSGDCLLLKLETDTGSIN